jgi:hypothetical protein
MSLILIPFIVTNIYAKGDDECPKIICDGWENDTCIITKLGQITINANSCPAGKQCSMNDLDYSVTHFTPNESYPCKVLTEVSLNNSTRLLQASLNITLCKCELRYLNKELLEGSHPKKCSSERDCMLKDSSTTECKCAPNGNKYCKPDCNSHAYDDFWNICEKGEMSQGYYYNWSILEQYYVYLVEHPVCLTEAFIELKVAFETAIEARDDADLSGLLAVSGLMWIILLS